MRLLRVILFILAFSLDIQVQAKSNVVTKPTEQPQNCLTQKQEACALSVGQNEKFNLSLALAQVIVGSHSAVIRDGSSVHLLEGVIWMRNKNPELKLSTEYGWVSGVGSYIVLRKPHRVVVRVLDGEALLHLRGTKQVLQVAPGQENWLGPVNSSGYSSSGIPQSFPFTQTSHQMARLFMGTPQQLQSELADLHKVWSAGVADTAALQKEMVLDEQSKTELRQAELARQQAEMRAKLAHIRALFRQRNGMNLVGSGH